MRISFLSIFFGIVLSSWICENPITLWDKATCSIKTQPEKYQEKCVPIRAFPKDIPIKGLLLFYTGFTACPDFFAPLIKYLSTKGYAVLVPLLPGHGISIGWNCFIPKICVSNGNNPSYLPKTKQEYIDFVVWSAETAKEEASLITNRAPDFFVGALGLSLGGSLGTLAMTLQNTPFTKFIAVNPFYAITGPPLDFAILECLDTADKFACVKEAVAGLLKKKEKVCGDNVASQNIPISHFIEFLKKIHVSSPMQMLEDTVASKLVTRYDRFITSLWKTLTMVNEIGWPIQKLGVFKKEFGWGPDCVENKNRAGICNFKIRNLLAVHTVSEFAVSRIERIKTGSFAVIHSDRDGPVRDSLNGAVISQLSQQGVTSSKCRFKIRNCTREEFKMAKGSACGAPHSLFARAENLINPADVMYWEKSLYENIANFFGGQKFIGDASSQGLDGSKCVAANYTINASEMFDSIGERYLKNANKKFSK